MASEREDGLDDAARRAAQDSAGELARMGIDPRVVGLEPSAAPDPDGPVVPVPVGATGPSRGTTYRSSAHVTTYRPVPDEPDGPPPPAGPTSAPPAAATSAPPAGPASAPPAAATSAPPARPASAPPAGSSGTLAAPPHHPAAVPPDPPAVPPDPPAVLPEPAPEPPGTTPDRPPDAPGSPAPASGPPVPAPAGHPDDPTSRRAGRHRAGASTAPPEPPLPAWATSTLSRPIAAVPPRSTPAGPPGPLDQVPVVPAPGPATRWRRLIRATTLGLVDPGAAAAVEYERRLVARARLRQPEPRVIAFLAGKGGVGTSTTAAGVALTLATLRTDTTALVSARSGAGSLGQRLLGQAAPPVPALAADDPPPDPLWVHRSLAVLDGSPWHTPIPRSSLLRLLEQLRSQHPLTVVDVGNDLGESAQGALSHADQVVLVTSASQDAVTATHVALSRVHEVDPFGLATVVVALTCLNRWQYRRTARRLRTELGMGSPRIVPIWFDPWLAAGDRVDPDRMRVTTREAYLRLAGLVVEPGRTDQWFAQPSRESEVPR